MIRELEAALERAGGNSLVEHFVEHFRLRRFAVTRAFPRTTYSEGIFLGFDRQIRCAEARDGHRYPVGVFAGTRDIVGWVARRGFEPGGLIDHGEQAIEPDGRAL